MGRQLGWPEKAQRLTGQSGAASRNYEDQWEAERLNEAAGDGAAGTGGEGAGAEAAGAGKIAPLPKL